MNRSSTQHHRLLLRIFFPLCGPFSVEWSGAAKNFETRQPAELQQQEEIQDEEDISICKR